MKYSKLFTLVIMQTEKTMTYSQLLTLVTSRITKIKLLKLSAKQQTSVASEAFRKYRNIYNSVLRASKNFTLRISLKVTVKIHVKSGNSSKRYQLAKNQQVLLINFKLMGKQSKINRKSLSTSTNFSPKFAKKFQILSPPLLLVTLVPSMLLIL